MKQPTEIILDTPFGKARLLVHSATSCYLGNLCSPHENPLTVNRVEYSISLHAELHNGEWGYQRSEVGNPLYGSLHMTRINWENINQRDASHKARDKAATVLFDLLNKYLAEHPEALVEAEKVRLANVIQDCQKKRKEAALLMVEAQDQADKARTELMAICTPEEQHQVIMAERDDLGQEVTVWAHRMGEIEERQECLCEQIAQLAGRRGAASHFLTSHEIDMLGEYLLAADTEDELGNYLRRGKFQPGNGQCYEVPTTTEEGRMLDDACKLLGIGG